MHMGVERVKEAKVQTLKSKFKVIGMKDGEVVEYFAMNWSSSTSICLATRLRRSPKSRGCFKLSTRDSCRLLPPSNNLVTSRTCQLMRLLVILRFMRRGFMATAIEIRRNTSYSHTMSGSDRQKKRYGWFFLFQYKRTQWPHQGIGNIHNHKKNGKHCA